MTRKIQVNQTALCGSLQIEDQSIYDVTPDSREDYGIAIFVSVDPGTGTFTDDPNFATLENEGTTGFPGIWNIDIPNSTTQEYEITTYFCPLWVLTNAPFTAGDIVYYSDLATTSFWRKNATGTGTDTPSSISTEWEEMTTTDRALFIAATNITEEINYELVTACPEYKVIFKECNGVHRIIDNSENNNTKRFIKLEKFQH